MPTTEKHKLMCLNFFDEVQTALNTIFSRKGLTACLAVELTVNQVRIT